MKRSREIVAYMSAKNDYYSCVFFILMLSLASDVR
jgi:hypothetical protein